MSRGQGKKEERLIESREETLFNEWNTEQFIVT